MKKLSVLLTITFLVLFSTNVAFAAIEDDVLALQENVATQEAALLAAAANIATQETAIGTLTSTVSSLSGQSAATFTAEVDIPSNSFVYQSSTSDDAVISYAKNAIDSLTYAKDTIAYGSINGNALATVLITDKTAISIISGENADAIKLLTLPATTETLNATVVDTIVTTFKANYARLVKLSNTKVVLLYKLESDATKLYLHTITINAGMTDISLNTTPEEVSALTDPEPALERLSATTCAVYYHDASDQEGQIYSATTGTSETAVMVHEGTLESFVNDSYGSGHVVMVKNADSTPIVYTLDSGLAVSTTASLTSLADTVEIGDITQLDTTYAVYVYKLGISAYMQAINLSTGETGAALLVGTTATGDNFAVNQMLSKLSTTKVAVNIFGMTRVYSIDTTTLVCSLLGTDLVDTRDSYNPIMCDIYSDGATTNPAIFRTHTFRPTTKFRKISFLSYASAPRVGYVATGVSAGAQCTVQLKGVITKTNTVTAGVPLYVDNSNALVETPDGCADTNVVGTKLYGTSILME